MHLGLNPASLKMSMPSRGADPRRILEKTTVPLAGAKRSPDGPGRRFRLERYPTKLNQFDGGESVFRAGLPSPKRSFGFAQAGAA